MDEYVASARSHWGPRFTANGVPAADFDRVMARAGVLGRLVYRLVGRGERA